MSLKISVVIEKDDNGYFAFCPELEGCTLREKVLKKPCQISGKRQSSILRL